MKGVAILLICGILSQACFLALASPHDTKSFSTIQRSNQHFDGMTFSRMRSERDLSNITLPYEELDFLAARFSNFIYNPLSELDEEKGYSYQGSCITWDLKAKSSDQYTEYAIYWASSIQVALLVFRGTETTEIQDILSDAAFVSSSCEYNGVPCGDIHRGFENAYEDVRAAIHTQLSSVKTSDNANKNYDLVIAGHSLGGALATLATFDLATWTSGPVKSIRTGTIGSPRVGDSDFGTAFNKLDRLLGYRRMVHKDSDHTDVVTQVPPTLSHVGQQVNVYVSKAVEDDYSFLGGLMSSLSLHSADGYVYDISQLSAIIERICSNFCNDKGDAYFYRYEIIPAAPCRIVKSGTEVTIKINNPEEDNVAVCIITEDQKRTGAYDYSSSNPCETALLGSNPSEAMTQTITLSVGSDLNQDKFYIVLENHNKLLPADISYDVSVSDLAMPPSAPSAVHISSSGLLTFKAPSDLGNPECLSGFSIKYGTVGAGSWNYVSSGFLNNATSPTYSFDMTTLFVNESLYTICVMATNEIGSGPCSRPVYYMHCNETREPTENGTCVESSGSSSSGWASSDSSDSSSDSGTETYGSWTGSATNSVCVSPAVTGGKSTILQEDPASILKPLFALLVILLSAVALALF
eukprot:GCRY01000826.1.p1 GENE.GCRY01000826.1~~GCRY01000826.1.p1  ORF type:complete len:637 (+),score=100.26 GCRY01000826.1:68-1978(+)